MTQVKKGHVVFTEPQDGKMLRIKGTNIVCSKAADYEDKLPEYEEIEVEEDED